MLLLTWTDRKTGETKAVRFDVVSTESWEMVLAITTHPVEVGSDVADHAKEQPKHLTIHGFVSNTPLWSNPGVEQFAEYGAIDLEVPKPPVQQNVAGAVSALAALIRPSPPLKATVLRPTATFPNRARTMYDTLRSVFESKSLVRIVSSAGELDNMMIERLGVPRDEDTGDGLAFELDLSQVRIVKSQTVGAPQPAEARGQAEASKGSKSAQEKNDAKKQEKAKSIAASSFDGARNLLGGISKSIGGGN